MDSSEMKDLATKAKDACYGECDSPEIIAALIIAESNFAIAKSIESAAEQLHNIYCRMEH